MHRRQGERVSRRNGRVDLLQRNGGSPFCRVQGSWLHFRGGESELARVDKEHSRTC